jgi:cell division GTPase FtsZ
MTEETKTSAATSRSTGQGRSLQLGVVGLGQCGGNFAEAFSTVGYPALAMNISRADLRGLNRLPESHKLVIGEDGSYGAGGSLSIGGEALRTSQAKIEETTVALLDEVEVLVAVGALGGGTGGNLAELVNILAAQDFPVLALGILPSASEGHRTKTNALWALNELVDSAAEAILLVDNDKLFSAHGASSAMRYMQDCNHAFVKAFEALNRLPGNEALRPIRTFDPNDLRQVLRFGGVTVFGSAVIDGDITSESLVAAFSDALNKNELLAGGFESHDAVMVASVITADEASLYDVQASVFDDYLREVRRMTVGAAHRTGLFVGEGPAMLHVVVAGLPLPSRAVDMLGEASSEMKAFGDKKLAARSKLKKLDLSALGIVATPFATGEAAASASTADTRERAEGVAAAAGSFNEP